GAQHTPPLQLGNASPMGPRYGVQQSAVLLHDCCSPRQHSPFTHEKPLQQSLSAPHSSPPLEHPHTPLLQLLPQQSLARVHAPPEGRQQVDRTPKYPFVHGSPSQQSLSVTHAPPPDEQAQADPLQLPPQQSEAAVQAAPRAWLQHLPLTHAPLQHSSE